MTTTWKNFTKEEIASWPPEHKKCRGCQEVLPFSAFDKHARAMFGINTVCKICRLPASKNNYANQTDEYRLWSAAKSRAKKHGIPFTIALGDVVIPEVCTVLGIPIERVRNSWYAPSIDQIAPRGGYTPDNIIVMSRRANVLKNNATLDELKKLVEWMSL
jgi:uncharacterized protein (DUF3084 family)